MNSSSTPRPILLALTGCERDQVVLALAESIRQFTDSASEDLVSLFTREKDFRIAVLDACQAVRTAGELAGTVERLLAINADGSMAGTWDDERLAEAFAGR